MVRTYNLGSQVRYIDGEIEYLATIIAKTASRYLISVAALGRVINVDASEISNVWGRNWLKI